MRRVKFANGEVRMLTDAEFRGLGPLLEDVEVDISADGSGAWVRGSRYRVEDTSLD